MLKLKNVYLILRIFTVFLKIRNFISKIRRSKVIDYAALTFSHPEDLSTLWSMGEPENKRYLTDAMLSALCHLFAILNEKEDFEGSADIQ